MSKRFIVYDRQLQPLFDLDGRVTEATRYERINGEHKLDVKTTQPLEEGLRILTQDGTLKWREWVVDEPQEHKQDYDIVEGSYGCTWSMQYDLSMVSGGELWPGTYTPIAAGAALAMVLATQKRWEVGHVTVAGTAGTSLFDGSVWDYLGKLQETWGGEMEPRIEVDSNGVTHRYVDWLAHVGSVEATRRFDYGEDCTGIDRKPPVGPMCCRIVPRGGHDATDEDGISYSERVGVEEEPYSSGDGWVHDAGSIWIRDPDAEQLFRTPNPDGTWHYPEMVVTYDTDDPEELVWLASADIHKYTRPSPTYEADVLQFAAAGMDAHGVQLGDVVHIVDRKFGDAPLRIEARIVEMTVNELDESDVQLVIGEMTQGIESAFKSMRSAIDAAEERSRRIEGGGTIVYLQHLLDEINAEINGTGGYSYFVPGEGIITYDKRVADPLVGIEATLVTQIKGGNIRIANTKKPSFSGINDWEWKTVIVSGHIAAELVTAAHITAGYIGSSNDAVFLDFDNHVFEIGNAATIGDTTVANLLQDVASAGVDSIEYGTSTSSATEPTTWSTTAPTSVAKGSWLWIRTTYKNGTTSTTKAYAGTDGQNGEDGSDGVGIASTVIEYGTSADAATQPTTWSTTPPTSIPQATWLWVRTTYTYSNQSTKSVYTKSYAGTDGEDGTSVYVTSSTKSGDTTTVVLSDGTTLTIVDGEDGTNGTNGMNGYVHTAWANSADGSSDFSTTVSANKLYLGVYTDNAQADSQSPSAYSWSLIKGADGQSGEDGIGIASVTPQYYLSTSSSSATGGSWSSSPPTWSADHYIWTRSLITWDTTPVTTSTTTEVYDAALTQANQQAAQAIADAAEAAKTATNYLTFNSSNGLDVGYSGTDAKMRINGSGMEVFDANNVSSAKFTSDEARIGRADRGHAVMKTDSLALVGADGVPRFQSVIDGYNAAALTSVGVGRNMGNFGTLVVDELASMQSGRYIILHGYFNLTNETIYWVCTKGTAESGFLDPDAGNTVSYDGNKTFDFSFESGHATKGGVYITSCDYEMRITSSYATIGTCADAGRRKAYSVVAGQGLYALNDAQLSFGKYNTYATNLLLQGGYGSSPTSRSDKLRLTTSGNLWIAGTLTQNSDRRLKQHHAYLGEEASDFIRALRPALYTKDGTRHVGFYAQDVQDAEPDEWDTVTVTSQHTDESLDFDPLTLDYTALIAPLVAYAQQLEKRIDQQQQAIEVLTKRLDALEGR